MLWYSRLNRLLWTLSFLHSKRGTLVGEANKNHEIPEQLPQKSQETPLPSLSLKNPSPNKEEGERKKKRRKKGAYTTAEAHAHTVAQLIGPTTNFLTAALWTNTLGVSITAAAGTWLALLLVLAKLFTLCSFQQEEPYGPSIDTLCHYLTELVLGNLRACCLPWMW